MWLTLPGSTKKEGWSYSCAGSVGSSSRGGNRTRNAGLFRRRAAVGENLELDPAIASDVI